ncbi:MAG: hypothetical protein OEM91_17600 [Hyphomicrobiales bacterium]|nr:hypothetical protein [Hyphomicrobiales bacterium]
MRTVIATATVFIVAAASSASADFYQCRAINGVDGKSGRLMPLDESAVNRYTPILINTYTGFIRLGRKGLFGERGAVWDITQVGNRQDRRDWAFARAVETGPRDSSGQIGKTFDVLKLRTWSSSSDAPRSPRFTLYKDGRFFAGPCEPL